MKVTATEKLLKHPIIQAEFRSELNSNSFYFDKKIYQIKTSSDRLYLNVKDLNDTILKAYTGIAGKPIEFKNSEINQENNGGKRVLENSSQFIRKLNNLRTGLSCYSIGENKLITIGGVSAQQQTVGQITANQFGFIGALVGAAFFSPTMNNFNSYANKKVVRIESLFDSGDNHVQGDLKPLAFDKIRTFFDDYKDVSSQILFKMENSYYLGYYDNKTKEYTIRKFVD